MKSSDCLPINNNLSKQKLEKQSNELMQNSSYDGAETESNGDSAAEEAKDEGIIEEKKEEIKKKKVKKVK